MTENIDIPNKSHLKAEEVCAIANIKPYVLKYWESEFPEITYVTSSSGQKLYESKDVEVIAFIKNLLFQKDMTIEQAKAEVKLNSIQLSPKKKISQQKSSPKALRPNTEILMLAKKRLHTLLMLIESIKERHYWN